MGVVIIKDDIVEAILETGTVYTFVYKDSNIVVLILALITASATS